MVKQSNNVILATIMILLFTPFIGYGKGHPEPNTTTVLPSVYYDNYTTQEDLVYIYDLYDSGLTYSQHIYVIGQLSNNTDSVSKVLLISEFDAIDFELFTKTQEIHNKH